MEWRTLISDDGNSLSVGRIAFWLVFALSNYLWIFKCVAITYVFPASLLEILSLLLLYNISKKGLSSLDTALKDRANKIISTVTGEKTPPTDDLPKE